MGKVVFHQNPDPERLALERAREFNLLSDSEKWHQLFQLNAIARIFNGGKPLKLPQAKGLVIAKK